MVHDMASRDILGVASGLDERLAHARCERLHDDSCFVPSIGRRGLLLDHREQQCATWKQLRAIHQVIRIVATSNSGVPPSGETRRMPRRSAKTMPSLDQVMPAGGESSWHIVTAEPPVTAIRFSDPDQNTSDSPSGENTGFIAGSAPGIALDSNPDMERRYKRPLAAYTIRVPSGDIVTPCRVSVSNCPCGNVNANRSQPRGAMV